jgi:hypothetical protein
MAGAARLERGWVHVERRDTRVRSSCVYYYYYYYYYSYY